MRGSVATGRLEPGIEAFDAHTIVALRPQTSVLGDDVTRCLQTPPPRRSDATRTMGPKVSVDGDQVERVNA